MKTLFKTITTLLRYFIGIILLIVSIITLIPGALGVFLSLILLQPKVITTFLSTLKIALELNKNKQQNANL